MSHKLLKVQTETQNTSGEINVELNDLGGVSITSPSNTQVLSYNSSTSNWENQAKPTLSTTTAQYLFIGKGGSANYNTSGASGFDENDILYLYDTTPLNTITGASISKYSSTDWVESITLPSGTYSILLCFYVLNFTSTAGYLGFQFKDSSNNGLSDTGYIGTPANLPTFYEVGTISNLMVLNQQTTLYLKSAGSSNVDTLANQGTTPSESSSLYIERLTY